MTPALSAAFQVERARFDVAIDLDVAQGETVAILGPNGAGKSTVLQAIAGHLRISSGTIEAAGRVLDGPGVWVPPHRRRIGLMGQDPLLFPHLSARENVAFGPRSQGASARSSRELAQQWLERLDLAEFGDRRPVHLSGGQRQRVALARALAAKPDVLLLDEPLAAADVRTASDLRQVLRAHLREQQQSTVLVTHEVLDAAVLADRVLILQDGRVTDDGPTQQLLTRPGTEFGAALAGLNLLVGNGIGADAVQVVADVQVTGIADQPLMIGASAAAVFPPSAVALYADRNTDRGSPRNHWPATVVSIEPGPAAVRVRLQLAGGAVIAADVTPAAVAALPVAPGARLVIEVKAAQVQVFPR